MRGHRTRRAASDDDDAAIVKATISLAASLGLMTTAEGVDGLVPHIEGDGVQIVSYGRDGRPGGSGPDADIANR